MKDRASEPRRPPGLLAVAVLAAGACLYLAAKPVVTFPMALFAGTCFALYWVPPREGMHKRHYLLLVVLLVVSILVTWLWQRAWSG